MKCDKCGYTPNPGDRICINCGATLPANNVVIPELEPVVKKEDKKSDKKILIISIIGVVLLIIIVFLVIKFLVIKD